MSCMLTFHFMYIFNNNDHIFHSVYFIYLQRIKSMLRQFLFSCIVAFSTMIVKSSKIQIMKFALKNVYFFQYFTYFYIALIFQNLPFYRLCKINNRFSSKFL